MSRERGKKTKRLNSLPPKPPPTPPKPVLEPKPVFPPNPKDAIFLFLLPKDQRSLDCLQKKYVQIHTHTHAIRTRTDNRSVKVIISLFLCMVFSKFSSLNFLPASETNETLNIESLHPLEAYMNYGEI